MLKSLALMTVAALAFTVHLTAQNADPAQSQQPEQRELSQQQQQSMQQASAAVEGPEFLKAVAQSNQAEIELGNLAKEKASNPQVKQFAEMLVADHTKANQKVMEIGKSASVELPNQLTAAQVSAKDRLQGLSGAEFDKAFIDAMVENHQKGVEAYRKATEIANEEVRIYAESTLPTIRQHLQQAQELQKTLGAADSQPAPAAEQR